MSLNEEKLKSYLNSKRDSAAKLLCELIGFRSTVGCEQGIQEYLNKYLVSKGFAPQTAPIDKDIESDPDFTFVPNNKSYEGRPNLFIDIKGTGGGKSAIVNSHCDVVPAPDNLFNAKYDGKTVFGRGACDAKGQVLTILLAINAIKDLGLQLKGDLQAQIIIEEEAGGNGSLSIIKQGHKADCAVVLEPTSLRMHPANRGAVWFKLSVNGKSAHMGTYWDGVSAIKEMTGLIAILQEYEKNLREDSKGDPLFPHDPSPVNVNIGQIHGGDWPSTVPAECYIEGGIAFLPNRRIAQIYDEVTGMIESKASKWAKEHYSFEFCKLHNEAYETPIDHPSVAAFDKARTSVLGGDQTVGWIASCDGRLFGRRGDMPTITFGAGNLGVAHSLTEHIEIDDVLSAAEILVKFITNWCEIK